MNIFQSILTGFSEILNHKFQSLLTMLGVIFGISAVIAMVSIGEGAQRQALLQLKKLGANTLIINRVEADSAIESLEQLQKSHYGLSSAQHEMLKTILPIKESTVIRESSGVAMGLNPELVTLSIIGCQPNILNVASLNLAYGRFLTDKDCNEKIKVCVLGSNAAKKLFRFHNPIGQTIRLEKLQLVTCVGVLEEQENNTLVKSSDYNNAVYIPMCFSVKGFSLLSTIDLINKSKNDRSIAVVQRRKLLNVGVMIPPEDDFPVSSITIKMLNAQDYKKVKALAEKYLIRRNGGLRNFEIVIPLELIKQQQKTQDLFNMIMVAIASISLLVGGIGIMNIMLATVTQRTNEIGIRRCLGATKANILIQFVIESLIITMIGGAIGVLLGIILSWTISYYAKWPTVISYSAIVYAVLVSVSVGVIFGLYPAWKAASTDPIKALKFE